ncbi:FKBP-type peptidyl-prolyl isomerase domain protein [Geobacter metallireducens RCH3]|uniref:peptidylprolyl isomerase n=1 Tax=Geobacter metallireducens (strain ATCC 53774 / DSM 7210 / GS-15) TaxID=269799 RepID=Q39TN4_GEOMG|nr:FKBP-type peptidyl-prolyl cis-trans isomerase N-terminal domain-containing protein [Geobacter metallireducens]ABB32390.1 UDP-N-acetylglucosamine--undecaprenyl-phosphate N-acetylglucosamine-1-phosphate transferase and peptidylprolyl cis-trans isomerase, FKBP-type [Geobacter metallireducens GS-15]EHP83885.1 FKBP-type peptidyl-prolyl isomerase domain protein [Geobacter metallireducens RCH3]
MRLVIPCITSFLITAVLTPFVIRIATACRCVDVPGERRLHRRPTPRWGGAAFFAGVLPFLFVESHGGALASFIAASFILVGMGMVDDLSSLDWKMKFAVMAAAATIVIFGGNVTINHIGVFGSLGRLDLGMLSIPFTYIGIIGITNAINLLDGLDGLAGGVSLLGFLFMGIAALLTGNVPVAVICFAYVGALGAFLLFNFPNARIFMGDTGSLFLGFSLAFVAVLLTQGVQDSVDSMFPVLVLLIPIFDTLRVLLVRLLKKKNPFRADNLHLHYLMVRRNIPPAHVTLLFWGGTALFGSIALLLTNRPSVSYLSVVLYAASFLGLTAASLTPGVEAGREAKPVETSSYNTARQPYRPKEGTITVRLMFVLGVVFLATQVFAEEPAVLKTQRDKVNYAIGVNMVRNFTQQSVEIDLDMLMQGMRDARSGGKLLMTEEEIRRTTLAVQEEVRKRQKMAPIIAAKEGQAFLAENKTKEGVVTLPSGLQYKILKAGNGRTPTDVDHVLCDYRGTLLNGAEFDRSYPGRPVTFSVAEGGGIPGLSEALKMMPVNSKWQLFIPSQLAYGERGRTSLIGSPVGPNETIIVEVELLAIK